MANRFIFKLLTQDQWTQFQAENVFTGAPVDIADGYIHFSAANQVAETAAKYFAGVPDVVVAKIDTEQLSAPLKWEPSRGGALFPHLFGTLDMTAVTRSAVLQTNSSGQFVFPDWALAE